MHTNKSVKKLFEMFDRNGFEVRFAGGCVRDFLLGKEPKDVDFCTNATPDQMMELAKQNNVKVLPTGLQHGTVTFMVDGEGFEVTTLRVDKVCDGRHAEVEWTQDWEQDAARRDLTFNAMMMDRDGNLFDWFGGQEDLRNGVVRFVGVAEERVQEDFLRMLRFFRFANKFDKVPVFDQASLDACAANKNGLLGVSAERVWSEMSKVLTSNNVEFVLNAMSSVGLLDVMGMPNNPGSFHWAARAAKNGGTAAQVLGWLMRDANFHASKDDANEMADRMKMSNEERAELVWAVEQTLFTKVHFEDELVNGTPRAWLVWAARMMDFNDMAQHMETWVVPVFPVTGKDLVASGMKPGPAMGEALRGMRSKWMNSRFTMSASELME